MKKVFKVVAKLSSKDDQFSSYLFQSFPKDLFEKLLKEGYHYFYISEIDLYE